MKKEVYRGNLPHFQQPGQDYFVTWILKNSVPKKAVEVYSKRMEQLKNEIDILKRNNADTNAIENAKKDYYIIRKKYIAKVDEIFDAKTDNIVDLSKSENHDIYRIYQLNTWQMKYGLYIHRLPSCQLPASKIGI